MEKADLLDEIVEMARLKATLEAKMATAMSTFVRISPDEPLGGEFATDELAVALHCGRGRVLGQVRLVDRLRATLPATWAAWRAGTVDGYKAAQILDASERLVDTEKLAAFDTEAAERAITKTAPQLSSWLARKVARLEPDEAAPRFQRALLQRRVAVQLDLDGMGSLWATTNALDLTAIDVMLTRLAKDLGADDPRSIEQRRADLFVDRLLGRIALDESADTGVQPTQTQPDSVASPAPVVAVTVPIQSLLGVDDAFGEVTGSGAPVPAELAREVLAKPGTLVYRLLTDPVGNLLDVAQLGRFPTAKLGFAVDVRDRTCVFPSCNRAAVLCDCDPTIPHPEGPTSFANLGCLCRRHHRFKTSGQARLRQIEPGVFEWIMPTGDKRIVRAEPQPVGAWPAEPPQPRHDPSPDAASSDTFPRDWRALTP